MGLKITETLPNHVDLDNTLNEVAKMASENGIDFKGDNSMGEVSGKGFLGSYSINGRTVSIQIDKKPALIPEFLIKSEIKKFLQKL